jgi:hypothetical protein
VAAPGEIAQEIGRAYVHVFGGCLEQAIRPFIRRFDIYSAPHKLTFKSFSGRDYSFDIGGQYGYEEVFIESKGYSTGSNLLDEYRAFVAKAYVTSVQSKRHSRDLFWFVTNVPFGCATGSALVSPDFITESLGSEAARPILSAALIDPGHVRSLAERLAAIILTDAFIRVVGFTYVVQSGDTLWSILKMAHGGRAPRAFGVIAAEVSTKNNLQSPDRILAGQRLLVPWYGMPEA